MDPFMRDGFGAFSMMFNIVPIIVFLCFIFVFGSIIYRLALVARDKTKPIIPVSATVVSKRTKLRGGHHSNHMAHTYYYATFELENKERMELSIPSHQIGYLVEGDRGILSFQGNLFVSFERK